MVRPGRFAIDSLARVHALLLADDPASREEMVTALRYCGALVTVAETPEEALARLRIVAADVVLIALPGGDRRHLRLLSSVLWRDLPRVPVIVIVDAHDPFDGAPDVVVVLRRPLSAWDFCRTLASVASIP